MDIRPVETDADYEWALAEIERYFVDEPARGTPEADRFSVLAALIAAYEARYWPIEAPDLIDGLQELMRQRSLTQSDLADLIGKARASEILSGKRSVSMKQAAKLYREWQVPAALLLQG